MIQMGETMEWKLWFCRVYGGMAARMESVVQGLDAGVSKGMEQNIETIVLFIAYGFVGGDAGLVWGRL